MKKYVTQYFLFNGSTFKNGISVITSDMEERGYGINDASVFAKWDHLI